MIVLFYDDSGSIILKAHVWTMFDVTRKPKSNSFLTYIGSGDDSPGNQADVFFLSKIWKTLE